MHASLSILHLALVAVVALGCVRFWAGTRFWLPRYVHVLAAIALALGLAVAASTAPDAPVRRGPFAELALVLLVLGFPALVYGYFVAHGGQKAAWRRSHPIAASCVLCRSTAAPTDRVCASCGQRLDG